MILYMLEWDNDLDYDDHKVTLLGVYSSEQAREEAEKRYMAKADPNGINPFFFYSDKLQGKFERTDITLDVDLLLAKTFLEKQSYKE